MTVYGEAAITKFAREHAASRRPLQRFLEVLRAAEWPHFPAVKQTFPATDYLQSTGTMIFNIGGNKYRLAARVDFKEQLLYIERDDTRRIQPGELLMPTATYEELVADAVPQVIATDKQCREIGSRFGELVGKGRARTRRLLALLIEDYDRRNAPSAE